MPDDQRSAQRPVSSRPGLATMAAKLSWLLVLLAGSCSTQPGRQFTPELHSMKAGEQQITRGSGGRILTNTGVWSPDSEWIVYDTRSDAAGDRFDGNTIEMVNVRTGEVREVYRSKNGAHCGVATFHPRENKVVFILGPENPTPDWQYGPWHRQGVIVDVGQASSLSNGVAPAGQAGSLPHSLDARDLTPPFTPGALRGGSHVHVWDAAGEWVSFTYEDAVLAEFKEASATNDLNQRNVGVSVPLCRSRREEALNEKAESGKRKAETDQRLLTSAPTGGVRVPKTHPRNHDGECFSVLATRTTANPKPGSDEIKRAFEEAWVGTNGYLRSDGTRQKQALAFQGHVVTARGDTISEVFIADLPEDVTVPGDGPLAGTATRMPLPPKGAVQRRLTFTAGRKFPGLQGPRHWLRTSPDGARIAFLMKDDAGLVQLWTISPHGGEPVQVTRNPHSITSAFTWSPDGRFIAHAMDHSVCVTDATTGQTARLTPRSDDASAPRPEACVFSPDGTKIAFIRRVPSPTAPSNQIFVVGGSFQAL